MNGTKQKPYRYRQRLYMLILLPCLLAACSRMPPVSESEQSAASTTGDILTSLGHDVTVIQDYAADAGWLTIDDLQPLLAELRKAALINGYDAAWVQPDPLSKESFLTVATDPMAAAGLNGFFTWYLDPEQQTDSEASLMLWIDRLFSDSTRETAMAGGLYSDPRVVGMLETSLRLVLGDYYHQDILEFSLKSYRHDFSDRQDGGDPSARTWKQVFQRIEVSYEAAIISTITFRVLPSGS